MTAPYTLADFDDEGHLPDLDTLEEVVECRCGEPWPCAIVRAWEAIS